MNYDLTTYGGRKAYIDECQRRIDADIARANAERARQERRCSEWQKVMDKAIHEFNEPLRQLIVEIRLSMKEPGK